MIQFLTNSRFQHNPLSLFSNCLKRFSICILLYMNEILAPATAPQ